MTSILCNSIFVRVGLIGITLGFSAFAHAVEDTYKYLILDQRGPVLVVKLDNPPKNLMNAPMVAELSDLFTKLESDDATRAVVLTGNMKGVFIQHYDVGELDATAAAASEDANIGAGEELHATHQCFLQIERSSKPVIAAINGMAHGGGFELALACDFRYAAVKGSLGLPEANVGILPGAGGTQRLPRLIGMARAMELILQGKVVDPVTAERYGMVNAVYPESELVDAAVELGNRLATIPPTTLKVIKRVIRQGMELPLEQALRLEEDGFWELMRTEEAQQRMRAYATGGQDAN